MKTKILALILTCILGKEVSAQRNCGYQLMLNHFENLHPGATQRIEEEHKKSLQQLVNYTAANQYNITSKTTADSILIPIVFHIVVDSAQYKLLGEIAGIEDRIASQLGVINEDFNAGNADQTKIPAVWKPLFANVGISFGAAHVNPIGAYSKGYDLRIVAIGKSFIADDGGKDLKFTASGGLDAWETSKYLNIWVGNLKSSSSETILGITAPPGYTEFTKPELGVALNYRCFGARTSAGQSFIPHFDLGRTLTHELGHYFYVSHIWGDEPDCAKDDGFGDTPLQADNSVGVPTFPKRDACTPAGNGVMFMNYMDYSDDLALYMFTLQQGLMMKSQVAVGGRSYSLTQNPNLSDTQYKPSYTVKLFPVPTNGILNIEYDGTANPMERIIVYNMLGQKMIETTEQGIKSIDMTYWAKAVYFVHCYFKNEIIKQKISLQ